MLRITHWVPAVQLPLGVHGKACTNCSGTMAQDDKYLSVHSRDTNCYAENHGHLPHMEILISSWWRPYVTELAVSQCKQRNSREKTVSWMMKISMSCECVQSGSVGLYRGSFPRAVNGNQLVLNMQGYQQLNSKDTRSKHRDTEWHNSIFFSNCFSNFLYPKRKIQLSP